MMREVPGYPGYLVDESSAVYSTRQGFLLKLKTSMHKGYVHLQMRTGLGRATQRKVPLHQIVLLAFKGDRPSVNHGGRHLDGNRLNNSHTNLEWGTQAENINDAIIHGTHVSARRGELNPASKLMDADVVAIKSAVVSSRKDVLALASEYSVSDSHVYAIRRGDHRTRQPAP